jgi:DNA topoisomerase-3
LPREKANVSEESKPATQLAPQLFDLTSLQREANARFGFSAKNTLGLAQALYERHKVLTYPRTDAKALPEDYLDTVKQTVENLAEHSQEYRPFAKQILKGILKIQKQKRGMAGSSRISVFLIIPKFQITSQSFQL